MERWVARDMHVVYLPMSVMTEGGWKCQVMGGLFVWVDRDLNARYVQICVTMYDLWFRLQG